MKPRVLVAATVAVIAAMPMIAPAFYVTLLNYIGLYSLVALGLVLLTGVAGQTSFGQAAFVGLGAYTTAVLTTQYGLSPWITLFIAIAITLVIGYALGIITLRLVAGYCIKLLERQPWLEHTAFLLVGFRVPTIVIAGRLFG